MDEQAFLARLRATFHAEADEHVRAISGGLLALEREADPQARARELETVFRHAHSLKGAARAVNLAPIERICQALEHVLAEWKRGTAGFGAEGFDTLHAAIDLIGSLAAATEDEPSAAQGAAISALVRQLGALSSGSVIEQSAPDPAAPIQQVEAAPLPGAAAPEPLYAIDAESRPEQAHALPPPMFVRAPPAETVRIATAKLDLLLLEAEEMLTAKQMAAQRVADLRQFEGLFDDWNARWERIQPQVRALRRAAVSAGAGAADGAPIGATQPRFTMLLEFLDSNCDFIRSLERQLRVLSKSVARDQRTITKGVDDLLSDSKKLLMLPFSTLSDLFGKMVRELSRDQGKEVDLVVRGGEVEIDKRILDHMKDVLIHLVRNSIDHGIEKPEQRLSQGKSSRATLTIAAVPVNGNKIEILVADDGSGIDRARVTEAAIRRGALSTEAAQQLDERSALELIFHSGVSTSPIVTEISGRGLGLAIVREQTESLGGRVVIDSRRGAGTSFRIVLPLTLATFRGVVVRVADRPFVIPTVQVERVARIPGVEVKTVENRETVALDGRAVALVRLEQALELGSENAIGMESAFVPVVVLGSGEERIAFAVDEVLNDEEVLVKTLARPLVRVRNIAGATVLASGKVAPILNVADLVKSARKLGGRTGMPHRADASAHKGMRHPVKVLLAEDSITSRMLLKGILESAGYRVSTAVDGVEAFTTLRSEVFDLVVSDVEMPRMNGFDLTARIRADPKLAAKPVVLVTALSSAADRERGIDVGANAYIVKSGFDQSNLLDVIRRLV
ncbi:hybrid sensor histidine kinase/response regulator [Aromatoleum toluclasticum]|uniref:hybrid sensor histidine kinase/response regulator n=1 Tax=Aromatoleum toluclasticum TaxID=92003 RepID=UPI0003625E8D|nr:response regulator [Aromatoleum toluclasticum]